LQNDEVWQTACNNSKRFFIAVFILERIADILIKYLNNKNVNSILK